MRNRPESITAADVLTPDEAASILKVHPSTVREMCMDGRLPCLRCGGKDSKRQTYRIPAWRVIDVLDSDA